MADMPPNMVIVDLDGTIADARHREHYAQNGEWDAFHQASTLDIPRPDVQWFLNCMINLMANQPQPHIVILTGRNERYRPLTEAWLIKNNIFYDELIMRPDNNFEKDGELKVRQLTELCEAAGFDHPCEAVIVALEDRDQMVEAYRELGIPCWQVQAGGY